MAKSKAADPVTAYAERAATSPDECRFVQLASQRHLENIRNQRRSWFPFYFDADEAADRIAFFRLARHVKGEWARRPIVLEPWQQFTVGSVFGWKREPIIFVAFEWPITKCHGDQERAR